MHLSSAAHAVAALTGRWRPTSSWTRPGAGTTASRSDAVQPGLRAAERGGFPPRRAAGQERRYPGGTPAVVDGIGGPTSSTIRISGWACCDARLPAGEGALAAGAISEPGDRDRSGGRCGAAVGLHFAGEDDGSPLNDYALAHPGRGFATAQCQSRELAEDWTPGPGPRPGSLCTKPRQALYSRGAPFLRMAVTGVSCPSTSPTRSPSANGRCWPAAR
jgi:hypothetical protein